MKMLSCICGHRAEDHEKERTMIGAKRRLIRTECTMPGCACRGMCAQ